MGSLASLAELKSQDSASEPHFCKDFLLHSTLKWGATEIDHAVINGKRLIPVIVREIDSEEAPSKLGNLNWIFFCRSDNFDTALAKLLTAVRTDYQWVQIHRRLQVRALEWERNNHENSFLLRGKDLQDAEAQVSAKISKDPTPTELQTQYIHNSRRAESRRQRNLLFGVGIALVVSLGLGLLAFINGQNATQNANNFATQVVIAEAEANFRATEQARAEEQTRIALSRSLATGSRLNFDKQYDLSARFRKAKKVVTAPLQIMQWTVVGYKRSSPG